MTHAEYLDQFQEVTVKVLPEVALALSKGEAEYAGRIITALRAKHDSLWDQRQATAAHEVLA